MKLEEAKDIIENEIDGCDIFSCKMCKRDCTCDNNLCVEEGCQLAVAVDTVLQELEHLQKENISKEKLIEIIDFGVQATNVNDDYSIGMCNGMLYIKSVILDKDIKYKECPKNSISKDKIREKIEEIKSRMNDDCIALHEFQREAKIDVLYELLKEE